MARLYDANRGAGRHGRRIAWRTAIQDLDKWRAPAVMAERRARIILCEPAGRHHGFTGIARCQCKIRRASSADAALSEHDVALSVSGGPGPAGAGPAELRR